MWGDEVQRSESTGLAFRRAGNGDAVVLLHGIPGCGSSWAPVAAALPPTLDVIVPDLLGFGSSDRPHSLDELHASAQAHTLARLLDELSVRSALVVGHDFGGPVAVLLSAHRPDLVAALGLLATNTFTDTPIPFPLSLVNAPVFGPFARRLLFSRPSLRMMLRQGVADSKDRPDARTHLGDRAQRRAIATIFAGSLTQLAELYQPVEAQLSNLTMPVFVGWGDRDPFFALAQGHRTARAAGTELRVYHGAGHFLPHERSLDLAADISTILTTPRAPFGP